MGFARSFMPSHGSKAVMDGKRARAPASPAAADPSAMSPNPATAPAPSLATALALGLGHRLERDASARAAHALVATPQPRPGPLSNAARPGLEAALGGSLAGVDVAMHDALGFGGGATVGSVVHLGPAATRKTLAHELAHVVQQRALGARLVQGQDGTVAPAPPADSQRAGSQVAAGPSQLRPVSEYLAPELRLPEPPPFGDALLALLVLDEPAPAAVATVVAREAFRRLMAGYFGPAPLIGVVGRVPEVSLTFVRELRRVASPDGLLHLEQLQALLPEGALEHETQVTLSDADQLATVAASFVAARHAVSGMPSLARRIGEVPERYSLDEVTELRDELVRTSRELVGDQPALVGPAWRAQLSTAARQVDEALVRLADALSGLRAHHSRRAAQRTISEQREELLDMQRRSMQRGGFWDLVAAGHLGEASYYTEGSYGAWDVLSGGAITDIDRAILDYRGGHISYDEYRELTRHAAWRAGIAVTLSLAAGFLGGGVVAAIGGRAFMATLSGRVLAGAVGGGLAAAGMLGGQDIYSGLASSSTADPLIRARLQAQVHSAGDYALGIGTGTLIGGAFGGGSYLLAPRPPGLPTLTTTPPLPPVGLFDAFDQPILVQGGRQLPPPPTTEPVMLFDAYQRPMLVQGGSEVPAASDLPLVLGPEGRFPPNPGRVYRIYTPEGAALYFGGGRFLGSAPPPPAPLYVRPGMAAGVSGGRAPFTEGVPIWTSPQEASWVFGDASPAQPGFPPTTPGRVTLSGPTPLFYSPTESGLFQPGGDLLTAPYTPPVVPANEAWRAATAVARQLQWQRNAALWGMTPAEYAAAADARVARMVANAEVRTRVPVAALQQIIRTGRLLNQFETGTSGGLLDLAARRSTEAGLWATGPEATGAQRPIYGYLSGSPETAPAQYGDVVLRLRPTVRPRTTFTFGDSLDETASGLRPNVAAEPLTRPSALAAQGAADPLRMSSLAEVASENRPVYTEAQVYGGIAISDIDEVVFTNGVRPGPQLRAALDAAGLHWRVVASPQP